MYICVRNLNFKEIHVDQWLNRKSYNYQWRNRWLNVNLVNVTPAGFDCKSLDFLQEHQSSRLDWFMIHILHKYYEYFNMLAVGLYMMRQESY